MTVFRPILLLMLASISFGCGEDRPSPSPVGATAPSPVGATPLERANRVAPISKARAGRVTPATHARPAKRPSAAAVIAPEVHLIRTSGSVRGPIPYLTVESADASNETPIVIALHGRGARADAFARLTEGLRLPVRFIVGRGPLPWGPTGGRQWFGARKSDPLEGIEQRVRDIGTLVDQLQVRYPGSPKPMLFGFSQGAMLAMQSVAATPERFSGVVALSGSLPRPLLGAKATRPVPMILTAGRYDTIVPPEATQAAASRLTELGHAPEVILFEGAHSISRDLTSRIREFLNDPR
jgi:phospholipase/carboxylesterase